MTLGPQFSKSIIQRRHTPAGRYDSARTNYVLLQRWSDDDIDTNNDRVTKLNQLRNTTEPTVSRADNPHSEVASMQVDHEEGGAVYFLPKGGDRSQASWDEHGSPRVRWDGDKTQDPWGDASAEMYEDKGPPRLFGSGFTKDRHVVNFLQSSEEGRVQTMGLLAQADLDVKRRWTPQSRLEPSDDLSQHSARLTQHLQQRGVVGTEHPTYVSNNYSWLRSHENNVVFGSWYQPASESAGWETLTPADRRASRRHLRDMLQGRQFSGGEEAAAPNTPFEHPRLPGF